jgi:hypothetical protein
MERASSLTFPGGRALAGWWRQLQPYRPQALWAGYLFLHRVEALVAREQHRPADRLERLALQAVALEPAGATSEHLQQRLALPLPAIRRLLDALAAGQLVQSGPAGWGLTERGRQLLHEGIQRTLLRERAVFPFVERLGPQGERQAPPHFFPAREAASADWQAENGTRFDPALLRACVAQPEDWKRRFDFPTEVHALVEPHAGDWQPVLVDRTERPLVALACCAAGAGADRLQGFAGEVNGWRLDAEPMLDLPAETCALLPELCPRPTDEDWRQAWLSWCRQRNLPAHEAEHSRLRRMDHRLEVEAPPRLVERLRLAKSDIFRDDAWVLAGDGYLRQAARLHLAGAPGA